MKIITTKTERGTRAAARRLAATLRGGEVIVLRGDMGAGKTVFAKGIAEGLGIKQTVVSPTFTIGASYSGRLNMHHFDMYRLHSQDEAEETGITELLGSSGGVCVIEWAERIPGLLPKEYITVKIQKTEDGREIEII